MASFSFVDCTDTTLIIEVSELPEETVVVDWYIGTDKSSMPYKGYTNVSGSSCTYTFKNLTPDSDYYVKIKAVDSDGGSLGVFTSPKQYSTEAPTIDPPKKQIKSWHWLIQNVDAPEWMTSAAYNAITKSGPVSDFRYQVWNDLVKKVVECKAAAGVSWNAKYLTQNNTLMTDTDKTLTATRFNSLRYNIGIHVSTGLNDVYKGDTVYGWYFTTLADALNTWIDALNGN